MPMFAGANYYIRRNGDEPQSEVDPKVLEGLTADKLTTIVRNVARSNSDLHNEAIRKADSYSFAVAHPEVLQTAANKKLIDHWLSTRGINQPTFPDFEAATQALTADGLLDLDKAEVARLQDNKLPRTFRGVLTGQTFDSVDDMIAAERQASIQKLRPVATPEEEAFEGLPFEQVQTLLREGERQEQRKTKIGDTQKNGDAWITINPWYVDNKHNAHLMKMQLAANGFSEDTATIEQFEICGRQLRESGLLTLNKSAVAKEHVAEVAQRASEAVKQPGSVFDNTTEDEMYNLDLEEVRRRANAVMGR